MLIGPIDLYNFIWLSLTTLAVGHRVSWKRNLFGSFASRLFNWTGWNVCGLKLESDILILLSGEIFVMKGNKCCFTTYIKKDLFACIWMLLNWFGSNCQLEINTVKRYILIIILVTQDVRKCKFVHKLYWKVFSGLDGIGFAVEMCWADKHRIHLIVCDQYSREEPCSGEFKKITLGMHLYLHRLISFKLGIAVGGTELYILITCLNDLDLCSRSQLCGKGKLLYWFWCKFLSQFWWNLEGFQNLLICRTSC